MKTEYIDSEIERMTAYEKTNDLSNYGQKILNELRNVKKQLTLTDVSQHRELLLGFQKSEYFDLYEQGVLEYKDAIEKYLA